jgi:nitrogen regulatory protein P-II 2
MKLITVIGEALAREPLKKLFAEVGASGYTLFTVEGDGNQGRRTADIQEFANIQAEVIVPPAVAEKLLERLASEFFEKFAMVAYETDIRVLRQEKF